jgi:hypothetical protein
MTIQTKLALTIIDISKVPIYFQKYKYIVISTMFCQKYKYIVKGTNIYCRKCRIAKQMSHKSHITCKLLLEY